MSKKVELIKESDLFYPFVKFNDFDKVPEYWIVPSEIVAEKVAVSHQKWLNTPGRGGKLHKDSSIRQFFLVNHATYPPDWEKTLRTYKSNINLLLS